MDILTPVSTSVYRYYDKADLLLYVGITSRGTRRQQEHNADKEWWPFVVRQEVEHYETRGEAARREKALIREYHPPFNRQHNTDHESLREFYLTVGQFLPERTSKTEANLRPRQAYDSVRGKVPLTQIASGNVAAFVAPPAFRGLILSCVPIGSETVLLRAPRKKGRLIDVDLAATSPEFTFQGSRGGIPKLCNVYLHFKVVNHRPFVVRAHEAVGEVAA